jgi:hypothetical protein
MQADQAGCVPLVKMAMHRIANLGVQAGQVVGLRHNIRANSPREIAAFRRFLNDEMDFAHGAALQ